MRGRGTLRHEGNIDEGRGVVLSPRGELPQIVDEDSQGVEGRQKDTHRQQVHGEAGLHLGVKTGPSVPSRLQLGLVSVFFFIKLKKK